MSADQVADIKSVKDNMKEIKSHVVDMFSDRIDQTKYKYHNLAHTQSVVEVVTELGAAYGLPDRDRQSLIVAAWFHDTGYAETVDGHEEVSAGYAAAFMRDHGWSGEEISQVEELIRVTKMGVVPEGLMQEIMKDADCHHLGLKTYFNIAGTLRDEWRGQGKEYSNKEWLELNLGFFKKHKFHTSVAESNFGARKRKNMLKLIKQLDEYQDYEEATEHIVENEETGDLAIQGGVRADRGIETMYRVTLRNHNQLSKIADNKSNIMLSINSIMLSILLSTLASKLDTNPHLIFPTIVLTVTCVVSVITAVLATRPKLSSAPYSDEAFLNNKFNMLFFGNFYKLPLDKFEWGVRTLMKNEQLLYGNLSKDLYFLGIVLAKKYRLLKLCYTIFMVGIVLSSLAFVVSFLAYVPVEADMLPELDE